jgi:hypothetical protein
MKDDTVEQILELCIRLINEDYKDWDPDGDTNNYFAYGPSMTTVLVELKALHKYFRAEAEFNRDIEEAYNDKEGRTPYKFEDEWPDFVDGSIV